MPFCRHDPIAPRRVFNAHIRRSLYLLEQDRIRLRFASIEPVHALPPAVREFTRLHLRKVRRKARRGRRTLRL